MSSQYTSMRWYLYLYVSTYIYYKCWWRWGWGLTWEGGFGGFTVGCEWLTVDLPPCLAGPPTQHALKDLKPFTFKDGSACRPSAFFMFPFCLCWVSLILWRSFSSILNSIQLLFFYAQAVDPKSMIFKCLTVLEMKETQHYFLLYRQYIGTNHLSCRL